jgi:hypothetical protein
MSAYREGRARTCVVCGARLEVAHWPNAWEKSVGVRPCCSDRCAKGFDADRHWMPSEAPALLSDDAASIAVASAKARMARGDDADPVARDLLLAGVPPWMVRNAVVAAGARASRGVRELAMLPILTLGRVFVSRSGDTKHDPSSGGDALASIAAWEARFGAGEGEKR